MSLYQSFDRIAVVHLPDRRDCLRALARELRGLDIDLQSEKVRIPSVPVPEDWTDWPSREVCVNFLSHLEILRQALRDGVRAVWILEDDAIFSRRMRRGQEALAAALAEREWDLCFLGHSLTRELTDQPPGLVQPAADFSQAYCYAVRARVLARLVAHLERAAVLPRHHPQGSRCYIDAAFTLFRQMNPDVLTLVHNPALSIRNGRFSRLTDAGHGDGDGDGAARRPALISLGRGARDHWWRLRA